MSGRGLEEQPLAQPVTETEPHSGSTQPGRGRWPGGEKVPWLDENSPDSKLAPGPSPRMGRQPRRPQAPPAVVNRGRPGSKHLARAAPGQENENPPAGKRGETHQTGATKDRNETDHHVGNRASSRAGASRWLRALPLHHVCVNSTEMTPLKVSINSCSFPPGIQLIRCENAVTADSDLIKH